MCYTSTGFMGGHIPNPSYQQVCSENTGHAETVEVVYDTRKLTTRRLLTEFFILHEFTHDRRADGGQYRSAIFLNASSLHAQEQRQTAREMISLLRQNGYSSFTEVKEDLLFYAAGNRHQQYCSVKGIAPKKHENEEVRRILTL